MYLNVDKLVLKLSTPIVFAFQQIKSKYKRNRLNVSGFEFMLMNYFHEADLHSYLFVTLKSH